MTEVKHGIEPSRTEVVINMQLMIGCCGSLYLLFAEVLTSKVIFISCLVAASLLVFGVVRLCKSFLDFVHRKLKVEELTKCRNDLLIAFGSITMCAVVLQVLVYSVKFDWEIYIFIAQTYIITTWFIYYFLVFQTFGITCAWIDMDGPIWLLYVLITNLTFSSSILQFVSCPIFAAYSREKKEMEIKTIYIIQVWCSIATGFTFSDFLCVCWRGVRLTNDNERRNKGIVRQVEPRTAVNKSSVKPKPEPISKDVAPKPICNICSIPYTETGIHTPRMIKECGHTICEQCAGKLLNAKLQNLLVCPFCQKVTVVNGPAGILPKNFALLEYRRDVVQRN